MKTIRKFSRNKKGVSTLFFAIYVALLAIVLISTTFIGISTSGSGLIESLKMEQERIQEGILISGPDGMKLLPDFATVESLRVKNTGSISVKIRALYIGQTFICDPSLADDTTIAPGEEKWINLLFSNPNLPITLDDFALENFWKVTTERGTTSSETGANILFDPSKPSSPQEFYIGPFMIFFDMFNWKSRDGPWESGWTIPKGTSAVTWRILVKNVDALGITISDGSFFTLLGNEGGGKIMYWYIDPEPVSRTFASNEYHYIRFSRDKNGNPQSITAFSEWTSCINFLTLTGRFENNSAIGQTIPFEAVAITPTPKITLTAVPSTVTTGFGSAAQSIITAKVTDNSGKPIANSRVTLSANLGQIPSFAVTNLQGIASTTFTAGLSAGRATITATTQGVSTTTVVVIGKP